jgi:hypothetical protein
MYRGVARVANRECNVMWLLFATHYATKVQPLSSARVRKRWLVAGGWRQFSGRKL